MYEKNYYTRNVILYIFVDEMFNIKKILASDLIELFSNKRIT